MSDSVQPHRRQPTRLHCPWDSPGKNTGVSCHFLLRCMKLKSQSEVAQSCPTLSDPMDCSLPGSSIHGTFQAKSTGVGCHCLLQTTLRSGYCHYWASRWHSIKESPPNVGDTRDSGSIPGSGRFPQSRKWQLTPVFLPGKFHGPRSIVGYSPWDHKEHNGACAHTYMHTQLLSSPFYRSANKQRHRELT